MKGRSKLMRSFNGSSIGSPIGSPIGSWVRAFVFAAGFGFFAASSIQAAGPCQQVVQACRGAGFIKGAWKQGKGLWVNCVNPIMQGTQATGATLSLPSVSPGVISSCKAKHPKFGQGKVGS